MPSRNFIAFARKGATFVRTYVPEHVRNTAIVTGALAFPSTRETIAAPSSGYFGSTDRMEDKNVSENARRDRAHPSRWPSVLETGNRVLPWHVSTMDFFTFVAPSFFLLFFDRETKTNETSGCIKNAMNLFDTKCQR